MARSEVPSRSDAVRRVCHVFADTSGMARLVCYQLRCQPAVGRRPVENNPGLRVNSLLENSAGLPEGSLICAQAKGTMEIRQDCANEAGGSFSLVISPVLPPYANTSGNTDSYQVRGQDGRVAVDSWRHQKRQGDED